MYPVCTHGCLTSHWSRRRESSLVRRGSVRTLYGQRTKTSDRCASGCFEPSRCSLRRLASSTARARFSCRTTHGRSDLGRGNDKRAHLAAAGIGVVRSCRRLAGRQRAAFEQRRIVAAGIVANVPSFVQAVGLSGRHRSSRTSGRLSSLWDRRFRHRRAALRVVRAASAVARASV